MYANLPCKAKIKHILPILPVYIVIFTVTFTVNYYIAFSSNFISSIKITALVLFDPIALMVIVTQIKSMITSPGYVPRSFKSGVVVHLAQNQSRDIYCDKCKNERPKRAHHCRICNKCTFKMDHHCPWVANCVGYYNQKSFYQFLFYATLGNLIGFFLLCVKMYYIDFSIKGNLPKGIKVNNPFQLLWYMAEGINVVVGAACAIAMTFSIGLLFVKQTFMLANNQTTIEKKQFPQWERSPYYNKDKMGNFKSVMGRNVFKWFSLSFQGKEPFSKDKEMKYAHLEETQ